MSHQKSKGHIAFAKAYDGSEVEFYERGDLVYIAPVHNVLDLDTDQRHGRYSCSKRQFALVGEVWDVPDGTIHSVVMSTYESE